MKFSIDARCQRRGYALEALRTVPAIVSEHFPDRNEIILTVHHTNAPAIALYKKAGFRDKGLRYDGEFGEKWIFHLELGREQEKDSKRSL